MERRRKLVVAYLGTPFHGWQRQRRQRTVQGELEQALQRITGGREVAVIGAGRTDAGVHAAAQVAHADLPASLPCDTLVRALNNTLPAEIRVRSAGDVGDRFHARFSARGKLYAYRTHWGGSRLPWANLRSAPLPAPGDWPGVEAAARMLVGRRDMGSFSVPDAQASAGPRTLFEVRLLRQRCGATFLFWGDGFLRYQVRRMVGALLEVGWGKRRLGELADLLATPRPGAHIATAPARGLTLEKVYYRRRPEWSSAGP